MNNKLESYKAGNYFHINDYEYFVPNPINYNWLWNDTELNQLLSKASMQIGTLNAYTQILPNVDLYIKMHARLEANKSSKLEGTKTEFTEDLASIDFISPDKKDDWQEVQNYTKALNYGIEKIRENTPLTTRLIKEIHAILMDNVRGQHKMPGEFRTSQNWIAGSKPSDAVYVPPIHTEILPLFADFEKFIYNDKINTPELIRVALLHYQFESIHPFCDGNGRIGRLIIPLYLMSTGTLVKPSLYVSDYIENNKKAYYELLNKVRTHNDMISWIKFFLEVVDKTVENAIEKFKKVQIFTDDMNKTVFAENERKILQFLLNEPVVTRKQLSNELEISYSSVVAVIKLFLEKNLIVEKTGYDRNQVFEFKKYVDLFL